MKQFQIKTNNWYDLWTNLWAILGIDLGMLQMKQAVEGENMLEIVFSKCRS